MVIPATRTGLSKAVNKDLSPGRQQSPLPQVLNKTLCHYYGLQWNWCTLTVVMLKPDSRVTSVKNSHKHTHTHTYTHTHTHKHMHAHTHTCTYTHTCTHPHAHTHTNTCTHTPTCTHTYKHMHAHTHTHTHRRGVSVHHNKCSDGSSEGQLRIPHKRKREDFNSDQLLSLDWKE